jgi:hypothetical protein
LCKTLHTALVDLKVQTASPLLSQNASGDGFEILARQAKVGPCILKVVVFVAVGEDNFQKFHREFEDRRGVDR